MLRTLKRLALKIPGVHGLYLHAVCRWKRYSPVEHTFTRIFQRNGWEGAESVSGTGSDLCHTRRLVAELPVLFKELGIGTLLDIPCGDFNWMRTIDLGGIQYTGADIVRDLVKRNCKYVNDKVQFRHLDLLSSDLPRADVVLCRDCLVHLSFDQVYQALANICRSGSTYLLTTTFPEKTKNNDVKAGDWRPLNLELAPFRLPPPLRLIIEGYVKKPEYADKSLGFWRVADIAEILDHGS